MQVSATKRGQCCLRFLAMSHVKRGHQFRVSPFAAVTIHYQPISMEIGQWSEPITCIWIAASFSVGRSTFEMQK